MNVEILNPITYPDWDELILSFPDYSFFHSSAWAKVLSESYGYTPMYFSVPDGKSYSAIVPMMEINSFLTGKRGVSLPFTDFCEPLVRDVSLWDALFSEIARVGKSRGWKTIEFRGADRVLDSRPPSTYFFRHTLHLLDDSGKVFSGLRDSTRRNIKKARTTGIEVEVSQSRESMEAFWRLNTLTRKKHGLPPQPKRFFERFQQEIISRGSGWIVLARQEGKTIAASVFCHYGKRAVYKYGASDMAHQHLRVNNLVMWEAIRWYSRSGYKSLCFGRTEPENQGLIQFKSGWGTTEQTIHYYRYDFRKNSFISSSSKVTGFHNKVFRNLPISISNKIGALLYKHVG